MIVPLLLNVVIVRKAVVLGVLVVIHVDVKVVIHWMMMEFVKEILVVVVVIIPMSLAGGIIVAIVR